MEANSKEKKAEEKKRWQKSYFDVLGLCCSSEVPLIENILNALDGVKHVSVIVPSRTVIVLHDHLIVSQLQIVKALNQARLEANVRVHGETSYKKKWPSPYTILCGVLLIMSLFKYLYRPFQWLAIAAAAVGIFPILWRAIASIRNLTLDINILALIAVAGTIVLKDYLEAGTIVFLFTIAEWLESMASHKATSVMSSLMNMTPQKAIIAETGEVVPVDEVKLNTVLAVKAGEVIPIDGIVIHGKSEVDEKTLTGESYPVPKQKDSVVWAGTINLNGYISVMTTALAEECVVAKMAKLVEEAQNSKSRTQRFIDRCAKYYTPGVLCISIGLAVIPAAVGVDNKNHWFHLALVVLVSACPCALILSTPVATFCALSQAATSGILIKGGDYLEILSTIKNVAFDKTGTITRGEFVVTDFQSLHDDHISFTTLLYWISSIESKSSHPMATALIEYGRSKKIEPNPEIVDDFENFPGEGVCGKIDGKHIYVGNRKFSQRAGCQGVPTIEGHDKVGNTIGYVYLGATPVGIFSLSDSCRSGVVEAIKELKLLGIKTAMLTGDSNEAAMHAQEQLGNALEQVHAELLPEDKAKMIEEFKKEGPTAMVGDGINDAPALASADIGISMGMTGSALATETGHVILMSNDIKKIPQVIKLARKCQRKVIENVILSILTKAAILALAFAGHPLVWAAVLADVGTCLVVIFNSMFLLRGGMHKHRGEKGCKSSHKKPRCKSHDHSCHETPSKPKECSSNNCASNHCNSKMIDEKTCTEKVLDHEADHCQDSHSHGCKSHDHREDSHSHASKSHDHHEDSHSHACKSHDHSSHENASKPKECTWNKCSSNYCNSKTFDKTTCTEEGLDHDEADHCNDLQGHSSINSSVSRLSSNSVHDHSKHENIISAKKGGDGHCHNEDRKNEMNFSAKHHHHKSIDIVPGGSCHGFPGLEKREIGGCCKSFRKECCDKHGRYGSGLSEIVIE